MVCPNTTLLNLMSRTVDDAHSRGVFNYVFDYVCNK